MTHKIKICENCTHNKVCQHRKYGFQCEDFENESTIDKPKTNYDRESEVTE